MPCLTALLSSLPHPPVPLGRATLSRLGSCPDVANTVSPDGSGGGFLGERTAFFGERAGAAAAFLGDLPPGACLGDLLLATAFFGDLPIALFGGDAFLGERPLEAPAPLALARDFASVARG